jgi:hypothetical protein
MLRLRSCSVLCLFVFTATLAAQHADPQAIKRGSDAVRGKIVMNPPTWSAAAYDKVWQQWGLKEKPADFAEQFRDRYGLHPASYDNGGLPMGLHYTPGFLGKGIVNDCLMCHAGVVAGQTVMGLGNASLDLQSLFDDLATQDKMPFKMPFRFSLTRGTIDPVNPVAFLMEFRNPDLSLRQPVKLDYTENVASDPPAWWLLKRKTTRNWTGGVHVNSTRVDMVNLLTPFNSPEHIKKHERTFADIHQFVLNVEAPKYPFPIDESLAERGRPLFVENCARCHGAYGPKGEYPNKVVPLKTVGTDPNLAQSITPRNLEVINKTWFAQEKTNEGGLYTIQETPGYQAPPLDGIWATAPYLHNASVPTLAHLLDSRSRPKIFTRSFKTGKDEYDAERVGWKVTELDGIPPDLPPHQRRRIHDATQPGLGNGGHTFGDDFTPDQRRAVIEYLKTL